MNLFNRAKGHLAHVKSFLKPNTTALFRESAPLFKSSTQQKKNTAAQPTNVFSSQQKIPQQHRKSFAFATAKPFFVRLKTGFLRVFAPSDGIFRLFAVQRIRFKVVSGVVVGILCTLVVLILRLQIDVLPKVKYGFELKQFNVVEDKIKQGDIVYSMLVKRGLSHRHADSLLTRIKGSYNFEKIKVGKPYTLLSKKEQADSTYLVFEPDPKRFIVFDMKTPSVKEVKRDVSVREFETGGKLKKTLYSSLVESGMSYGLIDMVQEALRNKLDIRQCEEGDEYKLIWEEELIDGRSVGLHKLKSVYVKGQCLNKPVYAFFFSNGKEKGWYEKDSLPVRDGFLDAPVKNSTITSSFSLSRFHPILHYRRPHYGTDYAAPRGTPIFSVADGVVEEAKYGGGNGKYVKIKHRDPYETQYLHMSRFASGIQAGTAVKQKQVIGYVGSTGLATGPHVCFRFSKLGTPINHLTERVFSTKDSIRFENLAATMTARLNNIPLLSDEQREQQKQMLLHIRGKK
jgi:Peptidase family M23/Csd3 second domain